MTTLFTESDSGFTGEQRAGSRLDYGLDWSDWLAKAGGDTIVSSTWTVSTPGPILTDSLTSGTSTSIWIEAPVGITPDWYVLENSIVTAAGRRDARVCLLNVKAPLNAGSALFPNRIVAVARLRQDRLALMAANLMPGIAVSDDYLWEKLCAAEAYVAGLLRVPLVPTRYFPIQPTADELAALGGTPWQIDAGYDYVPEMFERDKWGYLVTRHRPVISVEYIRFAYPTQNQGFFDVPLDWLRIDSRPGHVRIVPSNSALLMGTAGFAMTSMINRRSIPDMVQVAYTAGLQNIQTEYPEILDVIKKKAVLNVLADSYIPQSGSISADGLSQSMSMDISKYSDALDDIINGPKGTNGGLMTRIHGIRSMVF